jgi:hypothetical protein
MGFDNVCLIEMAQNSMHWHAMLASCDIEYSDLKSEGELCIEPRG